MSEDKNQTKYLKSSRFQVDAQQLWHKGLHEIEVFIMDDDRFYNDLLKKTFLNFQDLPEIKANYELRIIQTLDPQECIRKAMSIKNDGVPKIAFVDFHLGKGINGHQVIKLLLERDENMGIVLISQSEEVIGNKIAQIGSKHQNKIFKQEHATELCCMMLNRFIKTLTPRE